MSGDQVRLKSGRRFEAEQSAADHHRLGAGLRRQQHRVHVVEVAIGEHAHVPTVFGDHVVTNSHARKLNFFYAHTHAFTLPREDGICSQVLDFIHGTEYSSSHTRTTH